MAVSTVDNNHGSHAGHGTKRSSSNFEIRKINGDATVRWLSKGIEDFKIANLNSLLYGLVFVIAGAITIWFTRHNPVYVMALVTGFYLVGPPVATGLYDMSRRIEKGEPPSFLHAISVLGQNVRCLLGLTLILGGLMVAWTGVSSTLAVHFSVKLLGSQP